MQIFLNDCLNELKNLPDNSIDSLVTDPPAGISFMGKDWDSDKGGRDGWITWLTSVMRECHRVLKPGAHGLVWALPRTSHWTATSLENAGFEIRDVITHLFGSGFPKSLDISKAIDKAAGAIRTRIESDSMSQPIHGGNFKPGQAISDEPITPSASASAWQGWGTALKPASEHWILIRKPLSEKTVAANVLKHGCGGINIDGSRIEGQPRNPGFVNPKSNSKWDCESQKNLNLVGYESPWGRFPANLVLSHSEHCLDDQCDIECAVMQLDEQSGVSGSAKTVRKIRERHGHKLKSTIGAANSPDQYGDKGGASRFFYCAKISTSERNAGLDEMPDREGGIKNTSGRGFSESDPHKIIITKNHHPTVKPKKLMSYLIRMITPPSGTVLDPFMGSGSTGIAAKECGFNFIGIEQNAEYFEISKKRLGL